MSKFQLLRRISARIGAGFGVVLVIMLLMIAAACQQLWHIHQHQTELARHTERLLVVQAWAALVRSNLDRALTATRLEAAAADDPAVGQRLIPLRGRLSGDMADTVRRAAELQELLAAVSDEPSIAEGIARVEADRNRFVDMRGRVRDDIAMGEGSERVDATLLPLASAMLQSLDAVANMLKARSAEAKAASDAGLRHAALVLLTIGAAALLAAAIIAAHTSRSLTKPMGEAVELARRIAEGDLSGQLSCTRRDEIGELLRTLAQMQQRLRETFGEISSSAGSVRLVSAEVAGGNEDLSRRTESAASNLQQAASAMEDIATTAEDSAGSARMAHGMASEAAETAHRGGQVVSAVIDSMEAISARSERIAEIVGVIDSIASQTNILALNAAVEAARAGEQGRGFAVVAVEVRALARRSADAAKEIKALIMSCAGEVSAGKHLVRAAGVAMQGILGTIHQVRDTIASISASASQQSQRVVEVSVAVNQLDKMTQQNAALVEEGSASAHLLREQAERLTGLLSLQAAGRQTACLTQAR